MTTKRTQELGSAFVVIIVRIWPGNTEIKKIDFIKATTGSIQHYEYLINRSARLYS